MPDIRFPFVLPTVARSGHPTEAPFAAGAGAGTGAGAGAGVVDGRQRSPGQLDLLLETPPTARASRRPAARPRRRDDREPSATLTFGTRSTTSGTHDRPRPGHGRRRAPRPDRLRLGVPAARAGSQRRSPGPDVCVGCCPDAYGWRDARLQPATTSRQLRARRSCTDRTCSRGRCASADGVCVEHRRRGTIPAVALNLLLVGPLDEYSRAAAWLARARSWPGEPLPLAAAEAVLAARLRLAAALLTAGWSPSIGELRELERDRLALDTPLDPWVLALERHGSGRTGVLPC